MANLIDPNAGKDIEPLKAKGSQNQFSDLKVDGIEMGTRMRISGGLPLASIPMILALVFVGVLIVLELL